MRKRNFTHHRKRFISHLLYAREYPRMKKKQSYWHVYPGHPSKNKDYKNINGNM
jgi:hypothetical protein